MLNRGKSNILGVLIDAVDYEGAVDIVVRAARERKPAAVSALAVHGLMTGVLDREQRFRLNQFDLLVPDGQPVRWALNALYGKRLPDRVYGPNLTLQVCARAAQEGLPVYFYGSTPKIVAALQPALEGRFPGLVVAGAEPSKFRHLTFEEKTELASRIRSSGAALVFVGLGCPRQEVFTYELRDLLAVPVLAVGAAFSFLAGALPQAPAWMQKAGLEWFYRLLREPRRLWRRYLFLNPAYLFLVALQAIGLSKFSNRGRPPARELLYG
jgi:N-acetylglucosaminyldiphosphoundecaprenol N-acetyl-beta-D-mannosaminyltransferase